MPLRWTDQDSYRHLNNASVVTLLEEARIGLFFEAAAADGDRRVRGRAARRGLHVDYRRQVGYRAHAVRVVMWVDEVRAASFRVCYELHDGPADDRPGGRRGVDPDGHLRPQCPAAPPAAAGRA